MIDIASLRGLDAFRAADAELTARLAELDKEAEGQGFNEAQRAEFEAIGGMDGLQAKVRATIDELEIREQTIKAAQNQPRSIESANFPTFNVQRVPDDSFDLKAYRQRANSVDELPTAYRDGAMRVIEKAQFPTSQSPDRERAHIAALIAKHKDEGHGAISRRVIGTIDPNYQEAWAQYVAGGRDLVDSKRLAVLQSYTDADGGYALPVSVDPSFLLTNAGGANSFRQNNPKTGRPLARIETIVTKQWRPVSTAGATASYAATEVTAPTPTTITDITDLTVTPVRAQSWIPFTADYSEDYGAAAIAAELGRMIADAKDVLEADKFVTGSGSNEPQGIYYALNAAGDTYGTTSATFDLNALDKQEAAVGPRFRNSGRAAHVANLVTLQNYRQLGVAGQPANSIYDPLSGTLHGYPAFEASYMPTWATGDESGYDIFGDFQQFVIVDRLGLSTQFWPYVVDGSGMPLGQNGIYARWRNTSKVLILGAFRLAIRDAD